MAITFKQYRADTGRQFVGLMISEAASKELRKWCIENGFDLTKNFKGETITPEEFDFHTTIYFTSNEIYLKNGEFDVAPIEMFPESFELFGKDKNIPVLKLKVTGDLANIREIFKSQGLEDAWPTWKPHVSLSYNYSGGDIKAPLPDITLWGDKIVIKKFEK